jgi:hypothetical protein
MHNYTIIISITDTYTYPVPVQMPGSSLIKSNSTRRVQNPNHHFLKMKKTEPTIRANPTR